MNNFHWRDAYTVTSLITNQSKRIFQDRNLNIITSLWNVKSKSLSPGMSCCPWDGTKPSYPTRWMLHVHQCLHVQQLATSKQEEKSIVFGVGTDGISAQDMVFMEHLRLLSCNHYLAQRRILTFPYKTVWTAPEWAVTAKRIHPVYLATSSNDMKIQSLLDHWVTCNCFDF